MREVFQLSYRSKADYLEKLTLADIDIPTALLIMKSVEFLIYVNTVEYIKTRVIHINEHYTIEMLSYFRSTVRSLCLTKNCGSKPFNVITSFEFSF